MEAVDVAVNAVLADERRRPSRESIEVVREKYEGDQGVVAVEFVSGEGHRYRGLYGVQRSEDSWRPSGSASSRIHPARSGELFADSGGWSSSGLSDEQGAVVEEPSGAYGGWPAPDGVASVRLVDPAGRHLEDDVDAGVSLFLWSGAFGLHEAQCELVDAEGRVVSSGPLFAVS